MPVRSWSEVREVNSMQDAYAKARTLLRKKHAREHHSIYYKLLREHDLLHAKITPEITLRKRRCYSKALTHLTIVYYNDYKNLVREAVRQGYSRNPKEVND